MPRVLSDVQPGERVVIRRIRPGGSAIRQRLLDMGVTRGAEVHVERTAPLGDPIELMVKGYHLAVRKNEAAFIEVDDAE